MGLIKKLDVQLRLFLVVLVPVIPMAILIVYTGVEQRQLAEERALDEVTQISNNIHSHNELLFQETNQRFQELLNNPEFAGVDSENCDTFFADLVSQYEFYANMGAANMDGDIVCSAVSLDREINVASDLYFQKTVKTESLSMGEYQIGQDVQKPTLTLGYPLINTNNELEAVLFASIDLTFLNEFLSTVQLPEGAIVSLVDRNSVIMSRYPDPEKWVGRSLVETSVIRAISTEEDQGITEETDPYGESSVYFYSMLPEKELEGNYVVVSIPEPELFADANSIFIRNMFVLVITAVAAFAFAYFLGKLLIVERTQALESSAERMEEAYKREKNISAMKSEFVSIAAHQLRAPLSAVKWTFQMLMNEDIGKLTEEQKEFLRRGNETNERMVHLINDLLSVSRIEAGKFDYTFKKEEIFKTVNEAVQNAKSKAEEKNIDLTFNTEGVDSLKIKMDAEKITMAASNLIDNAIKYTKEGGEVDVCLQRKGDKVKFFVKDNGIGIPEEHISRLFTKFSRADNAMRKSSGTGLGLFIVKNIIDKHEGEVWVESEEGKGTTIYFTIPVDKNS